MSCSHGQRPRASRRLRSGIAARPASGEHRTRDQVGTAALRCAGGVGRSGSLFGGTVATSPLELHEKRFRENPDDRASFEFLEEQRFMAADWASLVLLYQQRQAAPALAAHPPKRAELAMRLGQVYEEQLGDIESALRAYTEAIRIHPKERRALRELRRIYAQRRSWETVLQIAEQEASIVDSNAERARLLREMGDVWRRELGDAAQAEELYARARAEIGDPASGEQPDARDAEPPLVQSAWLAAARGDTAAALAALERALAVDPDDPEALDLTLTVLEGAERHAEMVELLERRARVETSPETSCAVLIRLGEIQELLGNLADARTAYERAVAAHPAHTGARAALARLYRVIEAWEPLRSLLESAAEAAEGEARVDLLLELAELLEHELQDMEAARACIDRALQIAPDDPRLRVSAADLGDERVLTMPELEEDFPDEVPRGAEQRSTRVVGVLERKLAAREAAGLGLAPEAMAVRLRIAELRAGVLGEPGAAIDVLEPALASDPALLQVAPPLAGLYEQLGRLEPLIDLAERAAALSEASEQRSFWSRRAADAARAVGASERAIAGYRRLLEDLPSDRSARAALCDLHRIRGEAEPLAALLLEELCTASEDRELEIHLELAALHGESLIDPGAAAAHLRRAIELEPRREDLLEWALTVTGERGGPLAQLDFLEDAVDRAGSDRTRAQLLARRGVLLADTLEWNEEAVESWRAALALDGRQALARQRLAG
jgi:tetratricopeptide (TPR) repeat protein